MLFIFGKVFIICLATVLGAKGQFDAACAMVLLVLTIQLEEILIELRQKK